MFDKSCIVCDCAENLNTSMTITVEDQKISVKICDTHAEDITPKQVREAYAQKKSRIDKVMEEARRLGLEIVPSGQSSKIVVARQTQQAAEPVRAEQVQPNDPGDQTPLVPTDEIDRRFSSIRGVTGAIGGTSMSAEAHAGYNLDAVNDKLPAEARKGQAKLESITTSDGRPMAIPTFRRDGTGTTTICIAQTDDSVIQRRMKQLQAATQANPGINDPNYHSFKTGYDIRDCPLCRGSGTLPVSKNKSITCTRCGGRGITG